MYYRVTWTEYGAGISSRVYKAKDFGTMWRAVYYMNCERKEKGRPAMQQIKIEIREKCDGEYLEITGDYEKDLMLDTDGV